MRHIAQTILYTFLFTFLAPLFWWSKANGSCIIWLTDRTETFSILCCVWFRVLMSLLMPYLSGSKPFVSNYSSIEYTITCLYRVHPWLHVCLCYAINGQVVYKVTCSIITICINFGVYFRALKGNDLKSKCIMTINV